MKTFLMKREVREQSWKALNIISLFALVFYTSALGVFLYPAPVLAAPASIWTTQVTCLTPADQDANEYTNGDTVYVRGNNFNANTTYYGQIHGQPGGASADPGELVKEFTTTTDDTGYFCVDAYLVGSDGDLDDGVYTVDVWDNPNHDGGSKNDNYHVNGVLEGTLIVHKQVDTEGDGSFDVTSDVDANNLGFRWDYDDNDDHRMFGEDPVVPAGGHTVTEYAPAGYHFTGWVFGADQQVDVCDAQTNAMPIEFSVESEDVVEITLCNTHDTGLVTFEKIVNGGSALPGDWTFTIDGVQGSWHSGDSVELPTGTYTANESGPSSYDAISAQGICSDLNGLSATLTVATNGGTCTFTNDAQPATISVHKQVDTDMDGDYDLTDPNADSGFGWRFTDSDPGDGWNTFGSSSNRDAGAYTVVEDMPSGYFFVGWTYGDPETYDGNICEDAELNTSPIDLQVSEGQGVHITLCNAALGTIEGTKYYDWDRDGDVDENDQPIADWEIILHQLYGEGSSIVGTAYTNGDGHYSFTNLEPGNYLVCEYPPYGWQPTGAGFWTEAGWCQEASINETYDFHNYLVGAIHGQKWQDLNGNSFRDCTFPDVTSSIFLDIIVPCEPTLNGWTIFIDENSNGVLDEGEQWTQTQNHDDGNPFTTDDGWYWFEDLAPGTYAVCEVPQVGWNQTYPLNENHNCHTVTVPRSNEGDTCSLNQQLNSVISESMCDFGNQEQSTITVLKNVDTDGDGDIDVTGATNWTWDTNAGNQNHATGSTQSVAPGEITVSEDMQAGYHFTSVVCDVNEDSFEVKQGTDVTFETFPGGHYTCTFTNTKNVTVLGLTKEANPTTVNPLTTVTYTVKWSVAGNSQATGVVLTDPVPTFVSFTSANDGGIYDVATKTITWNLGTQAPGASGQVSWVGQTTADAPAGTIVNTATIDANETDPAISASASILVVIPQVLGEQTPELTIVKSVSPDRANPGDTVVYTVVVTNIGDGEATNVVVTDTLPAGFTFVDDGSVRTWALGTLAAGASTTITYSVIVGEQVTAGTYDNLAVVTSDGLEPLDDTATVTVIIPQVLGALVETGAGIREYLLFAIGLLTLLIGAAGLRRSARLPL